MKTKVLDENRTREFWERIKGYSVPSKSMTLAEYNALSEEEKQADIQYIITDDNSAGGATMEQVNEAIDIANSTKQDKLIGMAGQVVGFNASGNAVAQDPKDIEEIYSTEEVRIGTWIDGRPLYRIVKKISLNYPNGITGFNIYVGPEEQKIVNLIPMLKYSDGETCVFGNSYADSSAHILTWLTLPNKIAAIIPKGLSKGSEFTFVIEYTKTTDPAQTLNLLSSNDTLTISTASSAKSELTAIKSTEQGEVM